MADNPISHDDILQPGNPAAEAAKGLQELIKILEKLQGETKKTAQEWIDFLKKQNVATKEGQDNIKKAANEINKLNTQEKESTRIKKALEREQAALNAMNSEEYKNLIRLREAKKQLNREIQNQVKAQQGAIKSTNTWGKALSSFQFKFNALGNIVANFTSFISRSFVRGIKTAVKGIVDFDQAIANVSAITRATAAETEAFHRTALALGGATKFTAIQVAELQTELGKFGFTTKEILDSQKAILMLAAATNEDLATSAKVAAATIRGFGYDADQTQRVVDVMARSFTSSALDLTKFAESMKYVAPIARQAGLSVEEVTAMLEILANAGIDSSMAGTSLRNIMTELIGKGGDLKTKLADLSEKGLTLADAQDEVGKRAQTSLLVLSNQLDMLPNLTEALYNAAKASDEMAQKQLNTLGGSWVQFTSAYDRFVKSLAESEDQYQGVKDNINALTRLLNNASDGLVLLETEATKTAESYLNSFNDYIDGMSMEEKAKALQAEMAQTNIDMQNQRQILAETSGIIEKNRKMTSKEILQRNASAKIALKEYEIYKMLLESITIAKEDPDPVKVLPPITEIKAWSDDFDNLLSQVEHDMLKSFLPPISEVKDWKDDYVDEMWNLEEEVTNTFKDLYAGISEEEQKALERYLSVLKKREDASKESADKEKREEEAAFNERVTLANAYLDNISSILSNSQDKQLNALDRQYEAEKEAAGDNQAALLAAEEDYNKKKEDITRKYAIAQKAIAISQAIINGAVSITKTWEQLGTFAPAFLPFQIAAIGLQVAAIATQQFAEGGHGLLGDKGGVLSGKRHSGGGVNLGEIGEAEGGEYFAIINRRMTKKYQNDLPEIIDSLNNGYFHDVFGRANIIVERAVPKDEYTRLMYQLMKRGKFSYADSGGNTVIENVATGKKRIIKKR